MATIRKIGVTWFILVVLVALSACTQTYGRKFDTGAISSIEKGKTTKSWVLSHLGEPTGRQVDAEGNEVWNYFHMEVKPKLLAAYALASPDTGKSKSLMIMFKGDIVNDYRYSVDQ